MAAEVTPKQGGDVLTFVGPAQGQQQQQRQPPKGQRFREVLPKRGLTFLEEELQPVLCKPKLLPLKSFTLERLEKMQREASQRSQEQQQQHRRQLEGGLPEGAGSNPDQLGPHAHEPESVRFDGD